VAGPYFYGRQKLVQEIASGHLGPCPGLTHSSVGRSKLGQARGDLYIMGGRRSGKTSLLRRVEEVCSGNRERLCFLLDLQTSGRSLEGLFQTLRAELRRKVYRQEHLLSPGLLAAPDLFALTDELISQVEVRGIELLLLLDEAEVLLEMANSFPGPLARLWQAWRKCPAVQVVVAASRALSSMGRLLGPELSDPFWEGFHLRCLARLDDEAAEALIRQGNSSSRVLVALSVVESIKEVTGCQPYLLQSLCQRLYQPDRTLRSLGEAYLEVDDLLDSLFHADYQNLLPEERGVLWAVGSRSVDMGALRAATQLEDEHLSVCLHWLECLGYVQRREDQFYIANRFLASWLLSHQEELREMPVSPYALGELEAMGYGFLADTPPVKEQV